MDGYMQMYARLRFIVLACMLLLSSLFPYIGVSADGVWDDDDWSYYKEITFDHSQIPSNLTNFPVLINITDTDLRDRVDSTGYEIAFINDTGYKLNHEIEYWDNTTGRLIAWVNVSSLSNTTDTSIYMYYGNDGSSDQQNITGVWDSSYVVVHHMTDYTASSISDSTDNNHDGSKYGSNEPASATGKIYNAQNFDGSNDYITLGDHNDYNTPYMTVECWFYKDTDKVSGIANKHKQHSNANTWYFGFYDSPYTKFGLSYYDSGGSGYTPNYYLNGTSIAYSSSSTKTGTWYHCAGVIDNVASMGDTSYPLGLGYLHLEPSSSNPMYYFDGIIDEFRLSNIVRSAGWIKAEYNNMNNASDGGFFSVGAETGIASPRISSTYPVDGTLGLNTSLDQINVTIYDSDGDTFNWSIETNPDIGDASDTVDTNGTKTCAVTGLIAGTTYTVYVNMSDVYENTRNETFTFTTFGNITFWCYDETNPSVGLSTFGVEITNSHAYQNVSLTNGASISISDLPYGDVVAILVSSDGYRSRMYVYNISQGSNYQFYFYLPPDVDDETLMYSSASVSDPDADLTINLSCVPERVIIVQGWNESLYGHWYSIPETDYIINGSTIIVNESWLDENTTMVQAQYYCSGNVLDYILHVVNEANIGLDAVTVNVQRLIGSAYTTIASGLTDGNGDITLQLIPQMAYKIQLSKTEYITSTSVYQPVESVRTKTLILVRTTPEFVNESTVDGTITITASLLMNETIHVSYTDILDDTTTITICVYRNESMTLIDCYTVDDTSLISYYFTGINTTYEYQVVFVYTHGRFGTITDIRYLTGRPMITDTDEFDDLFDIFGDNPFGWSSCVGFIVLCAGVFSFGRRNSGVALVVTGGVMLFIEFTIGITMIGLPLGVLFIIVGVLLQWKNTSRESGYY